MDELKRWREERAIRQSLRVLRDYVDPDETPALPAVRRLSAAATNVRRKRSRIVRLDEDQVARPPFRFRLWPGPPRVSPVHPEWDDPTGRRLRSALYKAIAFHLLVIPSLLLLSRVHLSLQEPAFRKGHGQMQLVGVITAPAGGARRAAPTLEAPRAAAPARPKPEAPKAKPEPAKPPVKVATKITPRPDAAPKKDEGVVPKPVKDGLVAARTRAAQPDEHPLAENPPAVEEPATDPVATAGPLLSGPGPVSGSEAAVGGIDGVDFPYNYYLERIRDMIAQSWQIPQGLVSKGRRLQAVIRFRINRDGSITDTSVEEPSGFSFFDQAGLRAVSQVRRFPPLPDTFGGGFLVVHFQFTYTGR